MWPYVALALFIYLLVRLQWPHNWSEISHLNGPDHLPIVGVLFEALSLSTIHGLVSRFGTWILKSSLLRSYHSHARMASQVSFACGDESAWTNKRAAAQSGEYGSGAEAQSEPYQRRTAL